MSQLSLFGAESLPPGVQDLEGLLAGPAQVVRSAGGATLSLVLADEWRRPPVLAALEELGVAAELTESVAGRPGLRTAPDPRLVPLADRWNAGAVKRPPAGFVLDGRRLRWWCLAAGGPDAAGYVLGLGANDEDSWPGVGAALAAAGTPGVLLGPRAGGPAYRIVGVRRLARLGEA